MELISIAGAGFSIVVASLLLIIFIGLLDIPSKSLHSMLSCAVLLAALAALQTSHLQYFTGGPEPLQVPIYRLALFVAPASFYFFGRWAVFPTEPFRPLMLFKEVTGQSPGDYRKANLK